MLPSEPSKPIEPQDDQTLINHLGKRVEGDDGNGEDRKHAFRSLNPRSDSALLGRLRAVREKVEFLVKSASGASHYELARSLHTQMLEAIKKLDDEKSRETTHQGEFKVFIGRSEPYKDGWKKNDSDEIIVGHITDASGKVYLAQGGTEEDKDEHQETAFTVEFNAVS